MKATPMSACSFCILLFAPFIDDSGVGIDVAGWDASRVGSVATKHDLIKLLRPVWEHHTALGERSAAMEYSVTVKSQTAMSS